MALTMNLTKDGEKPSKLSLNLKKSEGFKVRLSWDGDNDLDLHAILGLNTGEGAKASAMEDILSPYNIIRTISGKKVGVIPLKADKTFEIYNGALQHSADATDGSSEGDDEYIIINPSKITTPSEGVIEIPLIAMIHPQGSGVTFKDVKNPKVFIENFDKEILFEANLSAQFGQFVGVQMGAVIIESSGDVKFETIAVGFNKDFNQVLEHFS
jgi:tellurium resistance protein TerD